MEKLEKIVKELKELETSEKNKNYKEEIQRLLDVMDQIIEFIIEDLSHYMNFTLWKKHYNEYLNLNYETELKTQLRKALIKAHVNCKNEKEEEEFNDLKVTLNKEKTSVLNLVLWK